MNGSACRSQATDNVNQWLNLKFDSCSSQTDGTWCTHPFWTLVAVVTLIWLTYFLLAGLVRPSYLSAAGFFFHSLPVPPCKPEFCKHINLLRCAWQELQNFPLISGSALHLTTIIGFLSNCSCWFDLVLMFSDCCLQTGCSASWL